jgi:prepilin-type N-terminal cleavage/methylation domain-containing protein
MVARRVLHSRPVTREGGFTLIELMVVVAIVAVLATIAIPSFFRESSKSKAQGEVAALFAELRVREEAYHLENGLYLSTGTRETDLWPATPSKTARSIYPLRATWTSLMDIPPTHNVYCSYVVRAGIAGGAAGTTATGSFGFVVPNQNWFYVLARCNMDGNSATDGYFFTSSVDTQVRSLNPSR